MPHMDWTDVFSNSFQNKNLQTTYLPDEKRYPKYFIIQAHMKNRSLVVAN